MSLFDNPNSILLLKKLLQPQENNDSCSDTEDENENIKLGPSHIGSKSITNEKKKEPVPCVAEPKKDTTIDQWLEEREREDNDILETRKRPEYTITYKQAVGTEDVFLQMGNKTSASTSCEDMVIEIKMPEETVEVHQMEISVTETEIDLATPVYRFKLPLVHPINPDRSSAKYFSEQKIMCITCRMNREYDFVNF